jgi:hypothetical protein
MILAILSDLHVEKGPYRLPPVEADVFVLAGDIGWGPEGVRWIGEHLGGRPTIYVAGNREHWHWGWGTDPIAELRRLAAGIPNLHFLQDEGVELDGLRFLGATLWTDYALEGVPEAAMAEAQAAMPDYRNGRGSDGGMLTAAQVLAWNRTSTAFLEREMDSRSIVVTHHAPSARSLKALRPGHVPTTASVTRLDALIQAHGPRLWVHGHTHFDCDYVIGHTRVVSNQRGGPDHPAYAPLTIRL